MIPIAEDARIDRHGSPYAIALHQQRKARLERFRIAGEDSENAQRLLLAPVPVELSPEAMPSETDPPGKPAIVPGDRSLPMGIGPASLSRIIGAVASFYGVTPLDMISERRTAVVMRPRQVAMYLCKALTPYSLVRIGQALGNRDHTTVISGIKRIEAALKDDLELSATVERLKQDFAEQAAAAAAAAAAAKAEVAPPPPPAIIEPAIRLVSRVGNRYGRLIVLSFAGHRWTPAHNCRSMWRCRCDCGGVRTASVGYLSDKRLTQSCGCIRSALARTAQERGAIAEAARAAEVSA